MGYERNHGGASPRQCHPPRIRCYSSSLAIESRQCVQWPRRAGVSHAFNIVADKGAGDVLQTAMRHATHPPPVKTFRATAAPVCHGWGKSRAALRSPRDGTGKLRSAADAVFGNEGSNGEPFCLVSGEKKHNEILLSNFMLKANILNEEMTKRDAWNFWIL